MWFSELKTDLPPAQGDCRHLLTGCRSVRAGLPDTPARVSCHCCPLRQQVARSWGPFSRFFANVARPPDPRLTVGPCCIHWPIRLAASGRIMHQPGATLA